MGVVSEQVGVAREEEGGFLPVQDNPGLYYKVYSRARVIIMMLYACCGIHCTHVCTCYNDVSFLILHKLNLLYIEMCYTIINNYRLLLLLYYNFVSSGAHV